MKTQLLNENSLIQTASKVSISNPNVGPAVRSPKSPWYTRTPPPSSLQRKFYWILGITLLFGLIQLFVSFLAGSISLLNDSLHQLIDTSGIVVCIVAVRFSTRVANGKFTYGYKRLEIIGAILCNMVLIFTVGLVIYESLTRIVAYSMGVEEEVKRSVSGMWMMIGACVGIVGDIILMFLLKTRKEILNFYRDFDKCCH